jgi:hypothetical protein
VTEIEDQPRLSDFHLDMPNAKTSVYYGYNGDMAKWLQKPRLVPYRHRATSRTLETLLENVHRVIQTFVRTDAPFCEQTMAAPFDESVELPDLAALAHAASMVSGYSLETCKFILIEFSKVKRRYSSQ